MRYGTDRGNGSRLSTQWLAFFGRTRAQARRSYQKLIDEAFGKRAENPWGELRWGLALGNAALQKRVASLLRKRRAGTELKWVGRQERGSGRAEAALKLAGKQPERPWQVWVRVYLGGERRIDIARAYGYKDGSAITQMLKRLGAQKQSNPALAERMLRMEREIDAVISRIKRCPHSPLSLFARRSVFFQS